MIKVSIDALSRNVGYALRVLARTPGLTLTVILTLALGIGASSAVFTVVNAILLEPLPFPDADRLVSVRQTRENATVANVAPVRLEEWNERNSTFEALMGYTTQNAADASADIPESIRVAGVSPRLIAVWGIEPILGRSFVAADHEAGAADVALIAESLWERRFNRDPGVIGKIISSGDQTAEIVGVMPATFAFPDPDVEVWGATTYEPFVLDRYNAWFTSFGRLKPGVTVEQAQADLRRIQAQLAEEFPETDRDVGVDVVSLKATTVGSVRGSLMADLRRRVRVAVDRLHEHRGLVTGAGSRAPASVRRSPGARRVQSVPRKADAHRDGDLGPRRSRSRPARRNRRYVRLSCARAELSAARRHRAQRHDPGLHGNARGRGDVVVRPGARDAERA